MASYKLLAGIQAILIIICAFSLIDFGVEFARIATGEEGLGFNKLLFDSEDGIIKGTPLENNDFWTAVTFWGYLMLLVGAIQVIKGFTISERWN